MTASTRDGPVQNALIRAGAEDPARRTVRTVHRPGRKTLPLTLLSSPAAQAYAAAIRAAAVACRQMEMERGIDPEDGVTCGLVSLAESAEFACYGPKGLREV